MKEICFSRGALDMFNSFYEGGGLELMAALELFHTVKRCDV